MVIGIKILTSTAQYIEYVASLGKVEYAQRMTPMQKVRWS